MTNIEKIKKIRDITMSPFNDINKALSETNGDVEKSIELLVQKKQADANDMQNRIANNSIVYSYVHNNKIGAMIVMSCQTDFVAKTDLFLNLAKDVCMHIVSSPNKPEYVSEQSIPEGAFTPLSMLEIDWLKDILNKPEPIRKKIIAGKRSKYIQETCLLNQKFVKDDTKTIKQLVDDVASTVGEKIEIKKFIRFSAEVL